MPKSRVSTIRRVIIGVYVVVVSWAFFGPVGAFHWMVRFGVFGYLVYDEENSGHAELRFSPKLLVLSIVAWLACVAVAWFFLRPPRRSEPEANSPSSR